MGTLFLLAGLFLWAAVHFVPTLAPTLKISLLQSLGEMAYKGIFSLALFASLGLIVMGWRSSVPTQLYDLSALRSLALAINLLAFILMAAAYIPSRIARAIRHPQLTAVLLWASAHLLLNGDTRAALLFCGLAVWAFLEIILINRRDGEWQKKPAPPWMMEIAVVTVGVAVYLLLAKSHVWLSGVVIL